MCGIAALFGGARPQREREELVSRMASLLRHRGPDGTATVAGRDFSIGHRRLAIIDIEHGGQPMSCEDGRYLIALNGEIYNYLELREKLVRSGARFRTSSDTEVLLQTLIRSGPKALEELNGMYAFVFVDRQDGSWLIARDPLGIKPLYVARSGEELLI